MTDDLTDAQEDRIGEIFVEMADENGNFDPQCPAARARWSLAIDKLVNELGFTREEADDRLREELSCCDPVEEAV